MSLLEKIAELLERKNPFVHNKGYMTRREFEEYVLENQDFFDKGNVYYFYVKKDKDEDIYTFKEKLEQVIGASKLRFVKWRQGEYVAIGKDIVNTYKEQLKKYGIVTINDKEGQVTLNNYNYFFEFVFNNMKRK